MFRDYQRRVRAQRQNTASVTGLNWQAVLEALGTERERIRASARNHENRRALKAKVIDEYLPHLESPEAPGELLVWLMLWLFDCRRMGEAMALAQKAVTMNCATPDWLKRESVAEVIADEVILWAEDCHRLGEPSAPYLDDTLLMIENANVPDALLGRYYALKGRLALGKHGVSINKIAQREPLEAALPWFEKAMSKGGKVKTNLGEVNKRLKKLN